jgi:hypothetical protein
MICRDEPSTSSRLRKIWTKNPEIDIYQEVEEDDEYELPDLNEDEEGTGVEEAAIEKVSEHPKVGEKQSKKKNEPRRRTSGVNITKLFSFITDVKA